MLATDVYERSINPQWMQEFVVSWNTNVCWLRFDVWDRVRIFPDKPLGVSFFNVSQLQMGETKELWLPLFDPKFATRLESPFVNGYVHMPASDSDASSSTTPGNPDQTGSDSAPQDTETSSGKELALLPSEWGHLHVLVDIRPFPGPPRCMLMKLPKLRIVVDKQFYRPGDLVRGAIIYNIAEIVRIRKLEAYAFCKSSVHWSKTHYMNSKQQTRHFRSNLDHYKQAVDLIVPPPTAPSVDLRDTAFYACFEYRLPEILPTSNVRFLNTPVTTHTIHRVGVTSHSSQSSAFDVFTDITVLAHHPDEPNTETPSEPPLSYNLPHNGISYSLQAPSVILAGKKFNMNITVDNTKGQQNIDRLTFLVAEFQNAYATYGTWHSQRSVRTICGVNLSGGAASGQYQNCPQMPIPPGQSVTFMVSMDLPETVKNSVPPGECPLYYLQHAILISPHPALGASSSSDAAVFPILVSGAEIACEKHPNGTIVPPVPISSAKPDSVAPPHSTVPQPINEHLSTLLTTTMIKCEPPATTDCLHVFPLQAMVLPNNSVDSFKYLPVGPWAGAHAPSVALSLPSMYV